ncbi:MAG TPA: hypothetical protein VLK84_27600 [Longimicrobium sp.]|nr:hypothetical protein [Longimicrobium sp.]
MKILRILPLLLLLAACGPGWVAVAPGTAPMQCAATRLAARGYLVDTTFTDEFRLRVVRLDEPGFHVDTLTVEPAPPPSSSYWAVESHRWSGEGAAHRRGGRVVDNEFEVRRAIESCGIDTWAHRPLQPLVACMSERLEGRGFAVDTMQPNLVVATLREPSGESVVRAALLPPDDEARVRFTSDLYAVDDGGRRRTGADTGREAQVRDIFSLCHGYGSLNRPAWKGPLPGRTR